MKKIIIYSPYDCLVKTRNEENTLETNCNLEIDRDIEQPISIYPIGKNSKYSFNIDITDKTSKFYSLIEKDDKILIFLLDGLFVENVNIYHFFYKNKPSSIEISSQNIIFSTENNKKVISLPFFAQGYSCGQFSHILYVKFSDKQNDKLIAYNTLSNKAKMFSGEKIEIDKNGFIVNNEKTKTCQCVKCEYYIDNEGLKLKSKIVSKEERIFPQELITYQFLEAIKNNDFKNALSYLSNDLKNNVDEDSLKGYFGDISYFYPIDKNTSFAISDNQNILYEFSIINNKINEISDFK